MQIFEVIKPRKTPYSMTVEIKEGEIVSDVINKKNSRKVYLLVDHDTKRIWTNFGRKSSSELQIKGGILAGILRKQLGIFYRIFSLNKYSSDEPKFQEVMVKPISPGRAKPIYEEEHPTLSGERAIISALQDEEDGSADENGNTPYPYIFKPPSPPDDLALAPRTQLHSSSNKKDREERSSCQYCGMELTREEQLTHSCKEKPKNT
jgi:hypothetical protein